jgi:glutathione S-transferase
MLVLHHAWRSSASRRVRLCLAEKGLKFESVLVDLAKMEHHTPEYLKLNPNGVIPLLVLPDGRSLYESGTICEFLDESWPEPSLRPADPYGRAEMRNWIRHADERIGNLIIFNWKHSLAKTASQWSDEELAERLKRVPSKERQEAWLRAARRPYTAEEEGEARRRLVLMLDKMEESLGRHAWLVGDKIFAGRHRRRALRQAHRRGDRAGRGLAGRTPTRAGMVAARPVTSGLRRGQDRAVRLRRLNQTRRGGAFRISGSAAGATAAAPNRAGAAASGSSACPGERRAHRWPSRRRGRRRSSIDRPCSRIPRTTPVVPGPRGC